jgi:hypothetical protein
MRIVDAPSIVALNELESVSTLIRALWAPEGSCD